MKHVHCCKLYIKLRCSLDTSLGSGRMIHQRFNLSHLCIRVKDICGGLGSRWFCYSLGLSLQGRFTYGGEGCGFSNTKQPQIILQMDGYECLPTSFGLLFARCSSLSHSQQACTINTVMLLTSQQTGPTDQIPN